MKFKHGYEADNHAVNATPKEVLVKFSKVKKLFTPLVFIKPNQKE
jgi:hypothetical protein